MNTAKINKIAQLNNDIRQFDEAILASDDHNDAQSMIDERDMLLIELSDLEDASDFVIVAA